MTEPIEITGPGVYDGLPSEAYHAHPSLSSSGARRLLPPSCPALFKYEQDHPSGPKKVFELGHAAHKLVLGEGPELVRIDADEWRTKAVKEEVAEARAAGAVPLKPAEYDQVQEMAAALRDHPFAGRLFTPGQGLPEQSLFWNDERTGVPLRARLDWLPILSDGGRLLIPDYKTTRDASPEAISKTVHDLGYHQQARWYLDAVKALGLAGAQEPAFLFVMQEKTPPYLVTVTELTDMTLHIGGALNRWAIDIFQRCTEAGQWPGYADDVVYTSLPPWAEARQMELL